MKAVLALVFFAAVASALSPQMGAVERVRGADKDWAGFVAFVAKYERSYDSIREVNAKFDIFRENMKIAAERQARDPGCRHGATKFSDITQEEFEATYLMSKEVVAAFKTSRANVPPRKPHHHNKKNYTDGPIHWCTTKGDCSAIKDQGQCGSCWAFSTVETIESAYLEAGKQVPDLAPQQLVDCDKGFGDQGCQGGLPSQAVQYLQSVKGLMTEADYPYTAQDGQCAFDDSKTTYPVTGQTKAGGSDDQMVQDLSQATVSIGVDASNWNSYQGGVMTDCGSQLDHAVQLTGYGGQKDFWKVRNSWGNSWGEEGFIRLAYGQDTCGLCDTAIQIQVQ
jgi:hypothetical protein